jgi:hypothetical protein
MSGHSFPLLLSTVRRPCVLAVRKNLKNQQDTTNSDVASRLKARSFFQREGLSVTKHSVKGNKDINKSLYLY